MKKDNNLKVAVHGLMPIEQVSKLDEIRQRYENVTKSKLTRIKLINHLCTTFIDYFESLKESEKDGEIVQLHIDINKDKWGRI